MEGDETHNNQLHCLYPLESLSCGNVLGQFLQGGGGGGGDGTELKQGTQV